MDYWQKLNATPPSMRLVFSSVLREYLAVYAPSLLVADLVLIALLVVLMAVAFWYTLRNTYRVGTDCASLVRIVSVFVPRLALVALLIATLLVAYGIFCDIWALAVVDHPEAHAAMSTALVRARETAYGIRQSMWPRK